MIKEFHESKNLLPRPTAAKTETIGDITFALDNNGVITISGTASESVTFSYNLAQTYTMPTSKSQGGDAYLYLWNSTTTNGTIRFFYDDTQRDYWSMGTVNRVLTGFDNLENQTINRIEIRIPSGTSYNGTIAPMVTNDGEQATHFEPYGDTWNTKSYVKSISGAHTYTKFPIVLRTTEQSIPTWSVKGNLQQNGTPTPSNPVEVNGVGVRTENSFNVNGTYTTQGSNSVSNNQINAKCAGSNESYMWFDDTILSGTYKLSLQFNGDLRNVRILCSKAFSGGTYNSYYGGWYASLNNGEITITVSEDFKIGFNFIGDAGATGTVYNIMFSTDTNADYEPYGYKIPIVSGGVTTNVYLNEPLRKIGDYADTIAADGTVTRVIKKLVLTGDENWYFVNALITTNAFYRLKLSDGQTVIPTYIDKCTHYEGKQIDGNSATGIGYCVQYISNSDISCIQIRPYEETTYGQLNTFKTYLQQQYAAGTPVTVWYVIATPTTETVTMPTIPTTSGLNTIDVATTLKPSNMSLTYDGYKLCKGQRYVNSSWK